MVGPRTRVRWLVGAIVVIGVVLATAGAGTSAVVEKPRSRVSVLDFVIDGDTIALRSGEHVRLIGIDTPETKYSRFGAECYGAEASRYMESLLHEGDRVRLVFDVERRDRYDRLLAYVYRARDHVFINAEMIKRGYAYVLTVAPNTAHAQDFRDLASEARGAGRGVWSACEGAGS
jgi:micrococcal nuclease